MSTSASPTDIPHYETAIIGSGFSGLGMGIQLNKSGRDNFIILEKADDIGGTWRDNHYPGAACDIPSNMYSFSFEPNPNWSRSYSEQAEILKYMKHCANKHNLMPRVRLNSEVIDARWDNDQQRWSLRTQDGYALTAQFLVSGVGALSRPSLPKVKGLDTFKGDAFHSAQWNHDVDLAGKRVAVVGTGASAIQFIPQIAAKPSQLTVFQRTPPWVIPKVDITIHNGAKTLFKYLPTTQRAVRNMIYWGAEAFGLGFVNPKLMGGIERLAKYHLKNQVKDPALQQLLTPNYTIGCKRVLFSNNYYPALTRNNVKVVPSGVSEIRERSIIDSQGNEHDVDVIIFGTGFDVQDPFGPLRAYDRNGQSLQDKGMSAYYGILMPDVPNAFFLLGPNTGLGHNSIIFMIESQINYVLQCMDEMEDRHSHLIEVKPAAYHRFNQGIQKRLSKAVWSQGGCTSWYLNEKGENFTVWPGLTYQYWLETRQPNFKDLTIRKAKAGQPKVTSAA